MSVTYKEISNFLVNLGIEKVAHTQKNYLGHLLAVYRFMKDAGCDEDVCRAGMFHSIYGTEKFQGFKLPLERRDAVRALIGDRAERLAYLNCAMDRGSFDQAVEQPALPYEIIDRIRGEPVQLAREDFDVLGGVPVLGGLERGRRWREGGSGGGAYRHRAARLGGSALEPYERVFSQEQAGVGT